MDFSPSPSAVNAVTYSASASSSSSLLSQARMPLPRAFPDYTRRSFALAQQHPASSVQSRASIGRFSGAVHGNNARKGGRRRDTGRQDNDDGHEHESLHGEEMVDDNSDSHMFCDDVPHEKDSDVNVKKNSTRGFLSDIHMYDSIHGDFWSNDPYYQELETSNSEVAMQKQFPGECNRESAQTDDNSASRLAEDSSISKMGFVRTVNNERSRNEEDLMEAKCKSGNWALIVHETMETSLLEDYRSVFPVSVIQDDGFVSPSIKETCESNKDWVSSNMAEPTRLADSTSVLESDQAFNIKHQKPMILQIDRCKDTKKVREVGSAERPADSLGSLQNVESDEVEGRQCSGNEEKNGTDFEGMSVTKLDLDGSLGDSDMRFASSEACFVSRDDASLADETGTQVAEATVQADAITRPVVDQVNQVVEQVAECIPGSIKEQVVNVVDQVEKLPAQVSQVAEQVVLKVVDQVAEVLPNPVVEQVGQVADQVSQTAEQIVGQVTIHVVEPISTTASQIASLLSTDEDDDESDDEFEAYRSSDIPEFKGHQGLNNFTILQEDQGILSIIYDFYIFMLKKSLFEFVLGMFAAPILLSVIFTILYLPEFDGLALDETAREFFKISGLNGEEGPPGLQLSLQTVFQVFMFSVSLSTGLQPELAPLSPYTLVVANLNALIAQLIFVFLSGAVFARLSQPSQPVKCSRVALVCPPPSNRRLRKEARHKALLTRYVLVGPQPCELVDVKVDLTYKYNTVTRSGTYFRTSQSLKLVRPEIAFLNHGMLVRHIIDETSPLYQRTQGMLEKEDAVFSLSVVGLERSSMQSVFHVQHYCVYDGDVIWDAEFEDMILISKKNRRVVNHSLLSKWRTVIPN